ncbi:MAG: c-type cytochrome [Thermoanaerobaculia bacterium]
MKKKLYLMGLAAVVLVGVFGMGLAQAQMAEHKTELGKPLTDDHKMMMKNGAMKNMDKYMGSQEAMMKVLPMAMKGKQEEFAKWGGELFNSTELSTNGQSCASCHPGGGTTGGTVKTPMASELTGKPYELPVPSLVGAAATFPKFKVPNDRVVSVQEMSNNCIMMFMAAQPLPLDSAESRALGAYLTSLSAGEAVEPGKMPEMMKKMMEGGMGDMGG